MGAQRIAVQALLLGLPVGVFALLSEAVATAFGTAHPLRDTLLLVLYLAWLGIIVSMLAGLTLLALRRPKMKSWLEAAPYKLLVLNALLVGIYMVHGWAERFKNRELAALLVALLALACLGVGGLGSWALERALKWSRGARNWSPRRARRAGWAIAMVVSLASLAGLVISNWDGFTQLNASLFVTPSLAVLSAAAMYVWGPRNLRVGVRALWLGLGLALGCAWTLGTLAPYLPQQLASSGGWAAMTVRLVRAATDVDGDGYSSVMGGGDCRAFDPGVNPGAIDRPNDGVDSNCNGADASDPKRSGPVWSELPKHDRFNVVYVSVEALRPDHLSLFGYERNTSPSLARIAEQSVVFERAYSPSTLTRWALPSILSSLPPSRVPFSQQPTKSGKKKRFLIARDLPWLPSTLRKAGYYTAAVHTNFSAFARGKGIGLERGFVQYDAKTKLRYRGGTMQGFPGREQLKRAKRVLRNAKQPFFLWIHFVEPHFRYEQHPDAPDFGDSAEDRYDSEIWLADSYIGELYEELEKQKLTDNTIFVVSGDHGEEFKEHGKRFHGSNLFDPQVRTLLLMRIPDLPPRRVSVPVSLNQLPPTLLNLLDIKESFDQLESQTLIPLLQGAGQLSGDVTLELFTGRTHKEYQAAIVRWPHKLMYSEIGGEMRAFDLSADPTEMAELAIDTPQLALLKQDLQAYIDNSARRKPSSTGQR